MKEILLDGFMVFGPSTNYLFQVYKFNKTKSSKGFSIYLCLVTILSHTLKVFFWFSKKFKNTLLVQSILVIIVQLYLIYLCIIYQEKETNFEQIPNSTDTDTSNKTNIRRRLYKMKKIFELKSIWKWNDAFEYYIFYCFVLVLLSISYLCFNDNYYYSFVIGLMSMLLEVFCSFPQIIELFKTKNQKNISKIMVSMWLIGNSIKVYYNIYNKSPIQLIIGAYIQVFCNVILITQIIFYQCNDYIRNNDILMNNISSNKILFDTNSSDSEDNKDNNS